MELASDFFEWLQSHMSDDPARLRLKYGKDRAFEILQIECRRKYGPKLADTLRADSEFVFPTALSGEQCTSDALARVHADLLAPGMSVIDLTAGLGIDAMAMARTVGPEGSVTAVERQSEVADALRHNARSLPQLSVICDDCREVVERLAAEGRHFDAVFIDPARRAADGGRVYALDQCEPDVVAMLPTLQRIASKLIVKASPMLDITHTLALLPQTCEVVVLGTAVECKELDMICNLDSEPCASPVIKAETVGPDLHSVFSFTRAQEAHATATYAVPQVGGFVLDPYPAVMKAAPFKLLCADGVKALAPNTHLWCSESRPADFPGRAWRVLEVLPYMSKHIKRYASRYPRVSVTARNFDMTSDALRSKLGVKDGPALRLFAVTAQNGQKLLITCDECK